MTGVSESPRAGVIRIHASAVVVAGVAVVIRGGSGTGKSDLALRLMGAGGRLVADDQVFLYPDGGALYAFAPAVLRGRLEVRGVGILDVAHRHVAPVGLVVELVPADEVERMPEPLETELAGVRLPCHRLYPFEAAAPDKVLRLARLCPNPLRRN